MEAERIGNQRYCRSCQNEYARSYRYKYKMLSIEQKTKANARSYANTYQRRGKIDISLCVVCGSQAEKHHEDYSKPLAIVWLCRTCHMNHHKIDRNDILYYNKGWGYKNFRK